MLRLLLSSALLLLSLQYAQARERLTWLVRDLPPFTIFEGAEKGQGVVDRMLSLLIEQMPEYEHSIVRVNRARGLQMLQDRTFSCDPTLLWTPARAQFVHFSQPSLPILSSGVVMRKGDQALLGDSPDGAPVNLKQLLETPRLKLGVVAERSYGVVVDEILRQLPDAVLSRHYGNDATANLLQMQQLGRLQLVLGYWPEMRYLIQQQGGSPDDYTFHPIEGVSRYQFLHVGCADTPLGREAITHIDKLLPQLRPQTLPALYAKWLDADLREEYLQQAPHLVEPPPPATASQP
ncbi:TIGR02285 family protein [Pseudomonas putida]|uniref:TIGR02285 family protein n=1 Tax=Pseudomonas putida TaxID=303 RepID=UPI00383B3CBB